MKWLGQHIVSLIARFRNDVYLEDISSGAIASGGNLGLDSNNKIVKANEATGDITGVRLTADDSNVATDSEGSADFTIAGGEGIDTSVSSTTVTIAGEDASTSNKGIASFSSDNFAASSGEITIKSGGVDLTDEVTGVLPVANTAAKVTSIVAGDGIDVSGATGDVTVTAETATDSNPGVVELATTAEADTGTDTARAVTSAGLKSHVDARYTYQYIPLSANATTPTDGDWMYASGNGIGNHLYNQNGAAGGTTASNTDGSASTITISKNAVSGGIMVPYDSILCGFYAQTRAASNHQKAVGIFTGQPIWNDYIDITAYLRGYSAQDISAGPDTSYSVRAVQHSVLNINYSLTAGEALYFCLKDLSGSGGGVISSATIVLKTLVP